METKLIYEAPEAQILNVNFENSILSGEPNNSGARKSYGEAEEI